MRISIKLMGMLRDKTPGSGAIELSEGATIKDALLALDIGAAGVQVFTVNGQLHRDASAALADGDELSVIPPVGGG
ncbi:MAG: MoaD/ThiS family protein [Pirellulales bacterium]